MSASVATNESIRLLLAANRDLQRVGSEVSIAYPYCNLNVPIIIEQPSNSTQNPAYPIYICKLLESIYGAKQAGEIWD